MRKVLELSEKQIERQILDTLRLKYKIFCWKQPSVGTFHNKERRFLRPMNPYVRKGVADILCVIQGALWAFEVKTRVGRQSEAQKLFEKDLVNAGGRYFIVRSVEDLEKALG